MQTALDLRTAILEAGGCAFTCQVTATLDDGVYQFSLQTDYDPQTGAALTITAPQEIAGLTAHVAPDGVTVSFDETLLDFGALAQGNVSALTAPGLAAGSWAADYIRDAGKDGDCTRFTCLHGFDADELQIDTWLDADGKPVRSEISCQGALVLSCDITDFALRQT